MVLREFVARHSAGIAIASIGWLMNIPYWLREYRLHSSLGHSITEHFSEDLYLRLIILGTIPIFVGLCYFWDKKVQLQRAVSIIANLMGKKIRGDVLITGALDENGNILEADGIYLKAKAARDMGASALLVPRGQRIEIDGLRIIEVSNIREALPYIFT